VNGWINQNGLPTDLLPHTAHLVGQLMGEGPRLVARYDCCWANLMSPIYDRIKADKNTLVIRGTKRSDMARLPVSSGDTDGGLTFLYPLQDWTNAQVFAFLREQGAPVSRIYDHVENSPECARCSAWWGEKRASYLREHHPQLYQDYGHRLKAVADAIAVPLRNLRVEAAEFGGTI
jgi:phosphoadenosine phosphosulfate reductase